MTTTVTNTTVLTPATAHGDGDDILAVVCTVSMVFFLCFAIISSIVLGSMGRLRHFALVPLLCVILCMTYGLISHGDFIYTRGDHTQVNGFVIIVNAAIWTSLLNNGLRFLRVPANFHNELRTVFTIGVLFITVGAFAAHSTRYISVIPVCFISIALAVMIIHSERLKDGESWHVSIVWLVSIGVLGFMYGLTALLSHAFIGVLGIWKALLMYFFGHLITVLHLVFVCRFDPGYVENNDIRTDSSAANGDVNQPSGAVDASLLSSIDKLATRSTTPLSTV
jgi:hypothetical protein